MQVSVKRKKEYAGGWGQCFAKLPKPLSSQAYSSGKLLPERVHAPRLITFAGGTQQLRCPKQPGPTTVKHVRCTRTACVCQFLAALKQSIFFPLDSLVSHLWPTDPQFTLLQICFLLLFDIAVFSPTNPPLMTALREWIFILKRD